MKRINVIGTSGSGKSYFSRRLADNLGIPCIEMDAIFWQPNWQHLDTETFINELRDLMESEAWVLDGNQSKTNVVKWQYVDTIVWLDFGFFRTFGQILIRSLKRAVSKQEIWEGTGNRESFRRNFFSSESVVLWMLKNYWKTKRKYAKLFANCPSENIALVRITSRQQAEAFLTAALSTSQGV